MSFTNTQTHTRWTRRPWLRALGLLASIAVLPAALPACASHVTEAIRACPCSDGNFCCESGVCAADQSSCGAATLALSQAARGDWRGYIENFQWNADDAVRISIAVASDGTLSGQVFLGNAVPPAPATDPTAPWPPGLDHAAEPPPYIRGFAYTAENIHWEARRLKFLIGRYEPWQPWCALQTSYEDLPGQFSCRPDGGATDALCDVAGACVCQQTSCDCEGIGVCACDATGCNAATEWRSTLISYSFDIALDTGKGDGSVNLGIGLPELHNLRLTRTNDATGGTGAMPGMGGGAGGRDGGGGRSGAAGGAGGRGGGGSGGRGCPATITLTDGMMGGIAFGPNNHGFTNLSVDANAVTNYSGQVVFDTPSLSMNANFAIAPSNALALDPSSGAALDPWLGEVALLPAGCAPASLAGQRVRVRVLWRLGGAIGGVPGHGVFLGTSQGGAPTSYADATVAFPTGAKDGPTRTVNSLDAVELTHTFAAGEDASEGVFLRAYLLEENYQLPTTFYIGSIEWLSGSGGVSGAGGARGAGGNSGACGGGLGEPCCADNSCKVGICLSSLCRPGE